MNVDDLDLPIGICQSLENERRVKFSSIADVNKEAYINKWIENSGPNNIPPGITTFLNDIKTQSKAREPPKSNIKNQFRQSSFKSSNSSRLSRSPRNIEFLKEKETFIPAGFEGNMHTPSSKKSNSSNQSTPRKNKTQVKLDFEKPSCSKPSTSCSKSTISYSKPSMSSKMSNNSDASWEELFENQNRLLNASQLSSNNEQFKKHMKRAVGMCSCKNCQADVPADLVWNVEEFEKPKFHHKRQTPPPLMKKDASLISAVMTAPVTRSNSLHINKSVVLTHGQIIPHPQEDISRTNFDPKIQKCLKAAGFESSKPVQSFGWPAIMRGNNMMIIHSGKTGKTLTYLPALCSCLIEDDGSRYERIPDSKRSPLLIILANNSTVAHDVYTKLSFILKDKPLLHNVWFPLLPLSSKKIAQFFNTKIPNSSKKQPQQRHLDILITTVDTLIVLLNDKIIDLKRLCHLVVENLNIILDKLSKRFDLIISAIESMLSHRNAYDGVQFIGTGEKWTKKVETFVKNLHNFPLIIIGNPMQAALYGRAQLQLKFVEDECVKPELLANLLESSQYYIYKCIVVCKIEETRAIEEQFASRGINFVTTTDQMHGAQIVDLLMSWKTTPNGKHIVLICTDFTIRHHIKVSNASFLVNYSLPPTWSIFLKRFSTLIDSYSCPLTSSYVENQFNCPVITYVGNKSLDRCVRIVNFFTSNGLKVPDVLLQFCKQQVFNVEQEKILTNTKLCKRLIHLGACSDNNCKERHIISNICETASNFPSNGLISGRLVNIRTINHYYLQILEVKDSEGVVHELPDYAGQVSAFLEDSTGFEIAPEVLSGQKYLYLADDKQFYRCIVLRVTVFETIGVITTENALEVEIFCLETGFLCETNVCKLYGLTEDLAKIPRSVVEIYVANIIPPFKESLWSPNAFKMLSEKLRSFSKTAVCSGNIVLRLNNTIWLDDFKLRYMDGPFVNHFSVSEWLKQKHIYESSSEVLENLYTLCREGGIELPEYTVHKTVLQEEKFLQADASWAHLFDGELNAVYFSSATSSDCIYVKHSQFVPLLKTLEESISSSRLIQRRLVSNEVIVGKYYCLLDETSGNWCRVLVIEVKDDIATCFFVDYGDYQFAPVQDLRFLSNEHLVRLPCQAIECSLYGTEPSTSSELIDKLYDLCYVENTDFYKTWQAYTLATQPPTYGNSKKFKVMLIDSNSPEISMNNIILEANLTERHINEPLDNDDMPSFIPTEVSCSSHDELESFEDCSEETSDKKFNPEDWDLILGEGVVYSENAEKKELPKIPQAEASNYTPMKAVESPDGKLLPTVNWYQTKDKVIVEFMFAENTEYKINILRNRFLIFSSTYKEKEYSLRINLFNTVRRSVTHYSKPHYIYVALEKLEEEKWPKLLKSDEKMRNIRYKTDMIEISDSEEEDEKENYLQSKDIDDKYFKNAVLTENGTIEEFFSDYDDSESDYGDGFDEG